MAGRLAAHVIAGTALLVLLRGRTADASACAHMNNCNGHGTCDEANRVCQCFDGFGSDSDLSLYKAPDCSQRETGAPAARACGKRSLNAWQRLPPGRPSPGPRPSCCPVLVTFAFRRGLPGRQGVGGRPDQRDDSTQPGRVLKRWDL